MINYNNRHFGMLSTSTGASSDVVFHYFQAGDTAWGTYEGMNEEAGLLSGAFVALVDAQGVLDLRFAHARTSGLIDTGVSISSPEIQPDGRIRLVEDFYFTSRDNQKGLSMVEEIVNWSGVPALHGKAATTAVDYDGRRFAVASSTPNGQAGGGTIFEYHQRSNGVWAIYEGGNIRKGTLIAVVAPDGALDMRYHHVTTDGVLMAGTCRSTPEMLADGRIRLHEQWQWTSGDRSKGESVIEELPS